MIQVRQLSHTWRCQSLPPHSPVTVTLSGQLLTLLTLLCPDISIIPTLVTNYRYLFALHQSPHSWAVRDTPGQGGLLQSDTGHLCHLLLLQGPHQSEITENGETVLVAYIDNAIHNSNQSI